MHIDVAAPQESWTELQIGGETVRRLTGDQVAGGPDPEILLDEGDSDPDDDYWHQITFLRVEDGRVVFQDPEGIGSEDAWSEELGIEPVDGEPGHYSIFWTTSTIGSSA